MYVTAIKNLVSHFLSSVIKYLILLAYWGSDLTKIFIVQDFITYKAKPQPSLLTLLFLKRSRVRKSRHDHWKKVSVIARGSKL